MYLSWKPYCKIGDSEGMCDMTKYMQELYDQLKGDYNTNKIEIRKYPKESKRELGYLMYIVLLQATDQKFSSRVSLIICKNKFTAVYTLASGCVEK